MIISVVLFVIVAIVGVLYAYFTLDDPVRTICQGFANESTAQGAATIDKFLAYYDLAVILLVFVLLLIGVLAATHKEEDTYYR